MSLLSIGDQIKPGTYPFHSRFGRAVNFQHNDGLISVVTEEIGPGPLNIVLCTVKRRERRAPSLPTGGLPPTSFPPLRITAATVTFANHRFAFTSRHRYCSRFALKPGDLHRFQRNLAALGELLKTTSPPKSLAFLLDEKRLRIFRSAFDRTFARTARRGVNQILRGDLLEGVRTLRGCGPGLTPAGDDFIAGLLIGLHFLQRLHGRNLQGLADQVFKAARGTNLFSNTFLDLARRGLLPGRVKEVLAALVTGRKETVRKATGTLLALGASSGGDLATGLFLTIARDAFSLFTVPA